MAIWIQNNFLWIFPLILVWWITKHLEKINENIIEISQKLEKQFPDNDLEEH